MRGAPSDPQKHAEMCQHRSESLERYLSNPEARKQRSDTMTAYLSSHPKVKQKRIEQVKAIQPLAVEKAREKTLEKPLSEEHKRKVGKKAKERWANPEYKKKVSDALKGENNPLWGKPAWNKGKRCPQISAGLKGRQFSEETRRKMSEAQKGKHVGEANPFYGKKHIEESLKKMFKSLGARPNKPEQFLIRFFQENKIPLRYVGDGQVIIDGKCPDFINNNGGKQLLELFGDHWHEPEEEEQRINAFAQYGFQTLIIWEHELKTPSNVLTKVQAFIGGN